MNIKNYTIIIEPNNCICGIIIDPDEYTINFEYQEIINYKINHKEKTIKIFSKDKEFYINNMNNEFIYYAFKTDILGIFIGDRLRKSPPIKFFEAILV